MFERAPDLPSLSDHLHAQALSAFLARATLATPRLDRETVAEVLSGSQTWPTLAGEYKFKGVSIPLSFFEDNGFVTFFAGWLAVHFQTPRDLKSVHPSVLPLIEALEHLKDICFGRNDLIQPHYVCSAHDLEASITGLSASYTVDTVLPELRLVNGNYHLPPGNGSFSPLVSTYLWRTLRIQDPNQAFERWLLYMSVNCDWAMPVLFEQSEHEERKAFTEQLLAWLAADRTLKNSTVLLQKQFLNENQFSSIASPTITKIYLDVSLSGRSKPRRDEVTELPKPSLVELVKSYPVSNVENLSDLESIKISQRSHGREPTMFYAWLIANCVENSIRIDGMMLVSSGLVEALLELAKSRPILKALMFNAVPGYESAKYKIFLLSQPSTCTVGLFHLTQQQIFRADQYGTSPTRLLEKGFLNLVFQEYLRALEAEADAGDRLIEVLEFLCESINFRAANFSQLREYQVLMNMLDCLDHKQVIQLAQSFSLRHFEPPSALFHRVSDHLWYLLGFWLVDRLDETGIDRDGTIVQTLKNELIVRYEAELTSNLARQCKTLEPTVFFSILPWHKIFADKDISRLLALSRDSHLWDLKIHDTKSTVDSIGSAVAQYLQILIHVSTHRRTDAVSAKVRLRATEIARLWGFGTQEDIIYLFQGGPIVGEYDLWSSFCSFTNQLPDDLYDDFIDRCVSLIPLNQLFILEARTTIVARSRVLRDQINLRQSLDMEDMGLSALEQAFVSACESGHTALSEKLLLAAKATIEERFGESTDRLVVHRRNIWLSYEYKWNLISLATKFSDDPDGFIKSSTEVKSPHRNTPRQTSDDQTHWRECDYFRRYITASVYQKVNPEKCVRIMEALVSESKDKNHSFMLLRGRIALFEKDGNLANLRSAFSQFMTVVGTTEPDQMPSQWAAAILETRRILQEMNELDSFWGKLSIDQKHRAELLYPYCKALIERGDTLVAKQVLSHYRELNKDTSGDPSIEELVNDLINALPPEYSTNDLVRHIIEQSQRNKIQLAKHYREIVTSEFPDYVEIVGGGRKSPEEFLGEIVFEVGQELVLRKKNIQIHLGNGGKQQLRITQEDLINDWFTSLFDKRMAEARIGFRDQKRAGRSGSGIGPGEVDGYITDSKNRRLALFEAFRLSSLDSTVISEHVNKIAGYDSECLSPVFIVAYCDVGDFMSLVQKYVQFITGLDYDGFSSSGAARIHLDELRKTDHIWMGIETRQRGGRDIYFYHLLLNLGGT
ncbi:hypothetical protein LGM57_23550 [Burkholderia cepacia]|uniref:hypothetical protein n=1 Tax=Burkholderia cepacia TaxID=292 RepID=UPI001CF5EDDF|nr:hypothetical protein [Burkholderia cepacia]MCA7979303.1 hypothetical protein [Burkholderia cepacia]